VSSCARPDYADRWPGWFQLSAGPQPGFAIKVVVDKKEPAELLAEDGSVCRTSVKRFAGTRVGKWIACSWQLPDPAA
jgi:hypothetical protein